MTFKTKFLKPVGGLRLICLAAGLVFSGLTLAQTPFASPDEGAAAFIEAIANSDPVAVQKVLGKDWAKMITFADVTAEDRYDFLTKAHQARSVSVKDGRADLLVGTDPWPLPIPMLQGKDGKWRFDLATAHTHVLERRIGANELAAIQALLASVDAQREYALVDRNGDGILEYAQRITSSDGKRDGLIWSASLGDESPLGEGFSPKKAGEGYHGYRFKLLTGQGAAAKDGARSYLIGKRMVTGFAMLAWPLKYGETGVMSFIVNQDGQVFEADLGPTTAKAIGATAVFNPGEGWKAAAHP